MTHSIWKRGISLLLAAVLLFGLTPAVFAEGESGQELIAEEALPEAEPGQEPVEQEPSPAEEALPEGETETPADTGEDTEAAAENSSQPAEIEEPVEETTDAELAEAVENPESAPAEELPEETPELPVGTEITFTLDSAFVLSVDGGARQTAEETDTGWALTLQLQSGCYEIALRAEGYRDGSFELTVTDEPRSIALEPERYEYGIRGMDNDYELTGKDLEGIAFMESCDYLTLLAGLVPGENYEEAEVMLSADSEEEALAAAAAYGAVSCGYSDGIAVLELGEELSVYNAVSACYAAENRLPVVQPVAIVELNPLPEAEPVGETAAFLAGVTSDTNRHSLVRLAQQLGLVVDENLRHPGENSYQYQHDSMNTYEAWGIVPTNVTVKVAVVDTGVNASHEDLNIAATAFYNNGISGNSYNSTDAEDAHGHGTHCAGILGAQLFNGVGGAGIDPWAELYCYRAMNEKGKGSSATIAAGINWAVEQQVDVISLSLGSYIPTVTEREAIQNAVDAGITVVVAAGNDGSNVKIYPACYNIPGVIVAGAVDRSGARAYYSNYGSWVDVYAPGSGIYSTTKGASDAYEYRSGTSMSTPAVAGACALYIACLKAEGKNASPASVEAAVKKSVTNGSLDCMKLVARGYSAAGITYSLTEGGVDYSEKFGSGSVVPSNLLLQLNCGELSEGETVYYTLDGSEPAFMNGEPVNGILYNGVGISLSGYRVGQKLTVTAARFAANGERGTVTAVTYSVGEPADLSAISITAPKTLEAGSSAALHATDYFGNDITEQVLWTATLANGSSPDALSITEEGVLTANVSTDCVILVNAYFAGSSDSRLVTVYAAQAAEETGVFGPATRVDLQAMHSLGWEEGVACTYNKYGALKTVTLYAADIPEYSIDETRAELQAVVWCGAEIAEGKELVWSSSKTGVADVSVTEDGTVLLQAKKVGTTVITAKTTDGSKKKATVTVYVKAPASYVDVKPKYKKSDLDGNYYLTAGKTVYHKAVVGDTYGKPSGYKTYWSATLDWSGPGGSGSMDSDNDPGYIRINKYGTLRLYNAVKYLPHYYDSSYTWTVTVNCEVWCDSYHFVYGSISYRLAPAITKLSMSTRLLEVGVCSNGYNPVYIDRANGYYKKNLDGAVSVTSSNPKVCGAFFDSYGFIRVVGGEQTGTAYVTVKALDGSGKKCSFRVVVR